jgi:copper chaperone CopZ
MIKKTFHIPDMYCSNCVMHLEALEDEIPGITFVQGSYKKQCLVVEYDEAKTNEAQIRDAIHELGYTAE